MAGSSFTGPLKIKKADGSKVTFVDADGNLVAGTDIKFGDGDALIDTNDNELMVMSVTAAAVNEITLANAATGNAPSFAATGGDTNVDLKLDAKGSGVVDLASPVAHSTEDTISASGAVSLTASITLIDSTSGVQANTLADGVVGQHKYLVMTVDGGDSVLTPANLLNGTTLTFDDVGDSAHLVFMGTGWVSVGGTATLA